jgi:DNA polymerase-3 subunit epsilon
MGAKSKLVVFDFETGGLDPHKHPAMEIGLVTVDQLTFQEELQYEALIVPYKGTQGQELVHDPRALEVHGIEPSRCIREGKLTEEVVKQLIALFKKVRPPRDTTGLNKPILCGHNVKFDVAFLRVLFTIHGENLSEHVLANNGEIIVWDTQQMAGQLWNTNGDGKYNLGACCERAGLGNFLAHSALADVKVTAELLRYFLSTFRGGGQQEAKPQEPKAKRRSKIDVVHKTRFQF